MSLGRILTYDEIVSQELPPVDWLIHGLVAVNDRCVIYGEWSSFKSWVALDMLLHLAAGRNWQGFGVKRRYRCVYVDEEMNLQASMRRVKRLSAGARLPDDLPFTLAWAAGVRFNANGAHKLLSLVRQHQPEVMVIDSLRRVLVGDEKEATDVSNFWRNLEPVRLAGITTIVLHHMNKDSEGERDLRDRASGSTDIMAGADSGLAITLLSQEDSRIKVKGVKGREGIPRPFTLQLIGKPDDPTARFTRADGQPRPTAPSYSYQKPVQVCGGGRRPIPLEQLKGERLPPDR